MKNNIKQKEGNCPSIQSGFVRGETGLMRISCGPPNTLKLADMEEYKAGKETCTLSRRTNFALFHFFNGFKCDNEKPLTELYLGSVNLIHSWNKS